MPAKRRALSCQSCRRLKTRCEVPAGSKKCTRCTSLRLECSLPAMDAIILKPDEANTENHCHCSRRLDAIEVSLAEIKELLQSQKNRTSDLQKQDEPPLNQNDSPAANDGNQIRELRDDIMPRADDFQFAPIKALRHLKNLITGPTTNGNSDEILSQLSDMGVESDELSTFVHSGFDQVSSWYQLPSPTVMDLKHHHQLLFAVCLLVGVQFAPGMNGSELHEMLYSFLKNHLGITMLSPPLNLSTIQTMLIFSTWNLGPHSPGRYIDSWLMSSVTITHCMLSFGSIEPRSLTWFDDIEAREKYRTWSQALLVHLKFAIGTGKPSIVERKSLHKWTEIAQHTGVETVDFLTAAELELYVILYDGMESTTSSSEVWNQVDRLRRTYLADNSPTLRYAFSCVTLVLARFDLTRLLRHIPNEICDASTKTAIGSAINRAEPLLNEFIISSTVYARPTYDYLLAAYAAVTLAEYAAHIPDIKRTHALMEEVRTQVWMPEAIQPVFIWATNVVGKKVGDVNQVEATDDALLNGDNTLPWLPFLLLDSMSDMDVMEALDN